MTNWQSTIQGKKNLSDWGQSCQPALLESQPQDANKHPYANDASLNLFLSTIQEHLNTSPATELPQSVPSHTLHSPNQPAKQTVEQISKALARAGKKHGLLRIHPGKASAFFNAVFEQIHFSHFQRNLAHNSQNKPWLQKITKALSQKVTQACREHLHSTAWAEIRA